MPENTPNINAQSDADLEAQIAAKKAVDVKQSETTKQVAAATEETTSTTAAQTQQPWTPMLVGGLSFGIMAFGVFMFCLIASLIKAEKVKEPAGDGQWLLRLFVVPLCVLCAVLLVIVGFSNEQTAPAVGLLGTIIGYLLGSASNQPKTTPTPTPEDDS